MQHHRGRLIDHVHLRVATLDASLRFYRAVLESLDLSLGGEGDGYFHADELYVTPATGVEGEPDGPPSHVHLAFQADSPEQVQRFYEAALAAGGRDNGAPGERPQYHPGYYAAFVLDPDGNNIEAVYHGPARRSAKSVVITPGP